MIIANLICYILVLIGAVNWGLVGIFNFNLITLITGSLLNPASIIIYVLVMLAGIWLIISPILTNGALYLTHKERM